MARSSAQTGKPPLLPAAVSDFVRRRATELGGIALLAAAAALLVALASYSPEDPSPNVATGGPVGNLLGIPGAYAADILLRTVGLAGVAMAALAGTWGWHVASHRGVPRMWLRLALLPLAVVLLAAALAALPVSDAWPLREGLGGVLGLLVLSRLTMFVNALGLPIDAGTVAAAAAAGGVVTLAHTLAFANREWRRLGWLLVAFGRLGTHTVRTAAAAGMRAVSAAIHARQRPKAPAARPAATRRRGRVEPHLDRPAGRTDGRTAGHDTGRADDDDEEDTPISERRDLVAPRDQRAKPGRRAQASGQKTLPLGDGYQLPPTDLLEMPETAGRAVAIDDEALAQNARLLESVLDDFGVRGEIVKVRPGPVVTLYELEPAPGTKSSRVIGLADDIARSMSAISVRVAVVPGRNVIGIELPNARREVVYLRELLASEAYEAASAHLPLVLGKDIGGLPVIATLERMPHLLIAGTTGSGKSVAINTMILSLLYRLTPEQCRFIMIDPKMLELSVYDDIPHLLAPVVTDPRKAIVALKWVVREMENRYRAMSTLGVRNITGYNARLAESRKKGEVLNRRVQTGFDPDTGKPVFEDQPLDMTPLPYIVVVVDEMADLMLVAGKDIEAAIQRLAQMARAAGIHLIMATQRPSVDVITGTIKANFPTRISFQVTSKIDSRTILGEGGAEQLLGQGDMLYMAGGGRISRVHGPFVSDEDVEDVVAFLRAQGEPDYLDSVTEDDDAAAGLPGFADAGESGNGDDGLYDQAVAMVAREGKASTSLVQRHLRIGYNRAARIIEQMESEGVISTANHAGKREVLIESR